MPNTRIYYNMDSRQVCDLSGAPVSSKPEISFGENPTWDIYLVSSKGYSWTPTGVVSWKAAVAFDFDTATAVACRTTTSITCTGCKVTVPIDANTTSFLSAVNGHETAYGWFELCGFDANNKRICYLIFPIIGRMILDADPAAVLSTPAATTVTWQNVTGAPTIPAPVTYTVNGSPSTVTSIAAGSNVTLSISNGVLTISAAGGGGGSGGGSTDLSGYQTLITASNKLSYNLLSDTPTIPDGADDISITDSGSYFTSNHVEGALQEIGAALNGIQAALEAI